MYYDEESDTAPFLAGLLIGALVGASVALLTTPKSGSQIRASIVDRAQLARMRGGRSRWLDEEDTEEEITTRRRRSRR